MLLRAPLVGLDVGPLPKPFPTLGLAAGARFDALELTLGARIGLAQTIWVEGPPEYGAEVSRNVAEFRACYALGAQRVTVAPCLVASVALLSASGVGDEVTSQTQRSVTFAPGVAALGRLRIAEVLSLVAWVDLHVETSRAQIVVDGLSQVAELSPFAVTTSMALEWSL